MIHILILRALGGLVLFDYYCPVNVQGYDPALEAKQYQTVSGGLAYTHHFTGLGYHLGIQQAIHAPDLGHQVLCPMQCLASLTIVNGCP